MTTRMQICEELRKRSYPQTADMLRAKIGKTTVQFLCRCLALERNIIERKIRNQLWYAMRPSQFKPYRIEYRTSFRRGPQWKVARFQDTELGARQYAAFLAKGDHQTVYRVLYRSEFVIQTWNDSTQKEIESWRDGRRTMQQLKKLLRDPSHSPSEVSTPAQSSPR